MSKIFYTVVVFVVVTIFSTTTVYGTKETFAPMAGTPIEYISLYSADCLVNDREDEEKTVVKMYEWVPLDEDLMSYIYTTCEEMGIDSAVFLGLIDLETGGTFNPNLISDTDDHGICQINRRYFTDHCSTAGIDLDTFDPYDPYQSVYVSLSLLDALYNRYGNLYQGNDLTTYVLSCYNRGETGVKNMINRGDGHETLYSRIVLERAEKYR